MKEKATKTNQSLEKALQIIEVMANSKIPMRLSDISESLSLPASTVLRFLNTLAAFDYVYQDPETLKYRLSLKFCRIGNLVSSQYSIREVVNPYLIKLSEECGESACLAIEDDMSVVYIDSVDGPDSLLRTMQRIGKVAPLHSTGVGKLLLLNYSEERLDEMIERKGLPVLTTNTISTKEELIEELEKIKIQKYALDDEECEIGVKCIAYPLRDYTGKIVASISVSGPTSRMNSVKMHQISKLLEDTSSKISKELGYE